MAVGMRTPRAGGARGVTMAADESVALAGAVVTPGGIEAFEGGTVGLKVGTCEGMLMCGRLPVCASLSSLFSHCITCRSSAATGFAGASARCKVLEGQLTQKRRQRDP
jgi:hypothetical protein